jgi:hypothetical protein
VPKPYLFGLLGLALSEKQIPQIVENADKRYERMEALERVAVLRRQMVYADELRARGLALFKSIAEWEVLKVPAHRYSSDGCFF